VTQVISGEGSLQRTRLTHSLEVQQIGEGIVQRLRLRKELPDVLRTHLLDSSLIRTISLVHDLGHPPFGHAGEEALNCMMRNRDKSIKKGHAEGKTYGFEGNGQTLRILARLEDFSENAGANLTRRSLLGVLKYPIAYSDALQKAVPGPILTETGVPLITEQHAPPKCYLDSERDIVNWLLKPLSQKDILLVHEKRAKSVDATIMDCSDDLAYSFADLQDSINLGLLKKEHLIEDVPRYLWNDFIEHTAQQGSDELFGDSSGFERVIDNLFGSSKALQKQIGRLMGYGIARTRVEERSEFSDPLYAWKMVIDAPALALVEAVKTCILNRVIFSARLQHGRLQGQMALVKIFDIMKNDPRQKLPEKIYKRYKENNEDDRVICDWLAGASEEFIRKIYNRLFVAGSASVTDRL
jgi:dGTPase